MNRRDFLKSLGALGLVVAAPQIAIGNDAQLVLPKGKLGSIYKITAYGSAMASILGRVTVMRGDAIVLPLCFNACGGMLEWGSGVDGHIIYTSDLRIDVTPHVEAHTVIWPLNDADMPMAYSVENVDGRQSVTWTPLRKLDS